MDFTHHTCLSLKSILYAKGALELGMVTSKNAIFLTIKPGYEVNTHEDMLKFLEIGITKQKWIAAKTYYGIPQFHAIKDLRLYCNEIDDENNLLQGKKSKLFEQFILNTHYKIGDDFSINMTSHTIWC